MAHLSDPAMAPHSLLTSAAFCCEKCSSLQIKNFVCTYWCPCNLQPWLPNTHVCPAPAKGHHGDLWGSMTGMSRSAEKTQLELDCSAANKAKPNSHSDFLSDYWVLCLLLWSHKDEPCRSVLRLRLVGGFLTVLTHLLQTWDPSRASLNQASLNPWFLKENNGNFRMLNF